MTLSEKIKQVLAQHPGPLYQTHTLGGLELNEGIRRSSKFEYVRLEDIKGKSVLDLGCATGAECFRALEAGASMVVGIDSLRENFQTSVRIQRVLKKREGEGSCSPVPANFILFDLSKGLPEIVSERTGMWDTLFLFAIAQHIGYATPWKQLETLPNVIYYESGADHAMTDDEITKLCGTHYTCTDLNRIENNRKDTRELRTLLRLEGRKCTSPLCILCSNSSEQPMELK